MAKQLLTSATQGLYSYYDGDEDKSRMHEPRIQVIYGYELAAENKHVLKLRDGAVIHSFRVMTVSGTGDGTTKLIHSTSADGLGDPQDVCAAVTASNTAFGEVWGAIDASTEYDTAGGVDRPVNQVEKGRYLCLTSTAGTTKVVDIQIEYSELEVN